MNLAIDIAEWRTRADVQHVWVRLPWDVRQRLEGRITIKAKPAGDGRIADAGRDDVLLRLPLPQWKAYLVIAHEIAHVAARHYDRLERGEISREQAEQEADRITEAWGFGRR